VVISRLVSDFDERRIEKKIELSNCAFVVHCHDEIEVEWRVNE
jgi:hypothetical protein